jgi:hypothetical protein
MTESEISEAIINILKCGPGLLVLPGPITEQTLKDGLMRIDAAAFDEAWRTFCHLTEQIDFIQMHMYGVPPDEAGEVQPYATEIEFLDERLREIAPLVNRLYHEFWAAFVPQEERVG